MKKYFYKLKILETAGKGLLEYISIVDTVKKKDKREEVHNKRHYRYLNGLYFVLTFSIYTYFIIYLDSLHLSVLTTLLIGGVLLTIVAFVVKFYLFDHNPFLHDADIDKYAMSENEFYLSCPMGYLNNARKLKIIFFAAHPFYKVERIDGEDLEIFKATYLNDDEMNEFYKVSYSLIMEIEIVTSIRSCIWLVLGVEALQLIVDLLLFQGIEHVDSHVINIVSFIFLTFVHTIYYFRTKGKYSKNKSYVKKANKLKLKLLRHLRAA